MSQHVNPPFGLAFGGAHTIRFTDAQGAGLLGYPLYCYDRGTRAAAFALYDDAKRLLERALARPDEGSSEKAEGKAVTAVLDALLDRAEATPEDLRIVCAAPNSGGVDLFEVPAQEWAFTADSTEAPEDRGPLARLLELAEALRGGEVAEIWYQKPGHSIKEGDKGSVGRLGGRPVTVEKSDAMGGALYFVADDDENADFLVKPDDTLTQRHRIRPASIFAAKHKSLPGHDWPITISATDVEKGADRAFLLSRIDRVAVEFDEIPF